MVVDLQHDVTGQRFRISHFRGSLEEPLETAQLEKQLLAGGAMGDVFQKFLHDDRLQFTIQERRYQLRVTFHFLILFGGSRGWNCISSGFLQALHRL
ncbi:hypothetical protein MAIT1_04231 [Magnetofaba australis IT-1]|uniref:Uncharacterized protein n=1 Tax=Magnetofaba australis IT-1 TaxID=1434232 RepID=A0A1Y2K503_9PROT|nr:hypothetical protein MAIT1_04231 [Magnetofaba australis IT-1]